MPLPGPPRALLLCLLATSALAGCAAPEAAAPEALQEAKCADVYSPTAEKQAIVQVSFDKKVQGQEDATFDRLEVAAQHEGEQYANKVPDDDGCLRFAMRGDGDYMFWAFGQTARSDCFWSGYFSAPYAGQDLVGAKIVVKRICT